MSLLYPFIFIAIFILSIISLLRFCFSFCLRIQLVTLSLNPVVESVHLAHMHTKEKVFFPFLWILHCARLSVKTKHSLLKAFGEHEIQQPFFFIDVEKQKQINGIADARLRLKINDQIRRDSTWFANENWVFFSHFVKRAQKKTRASKSQSLWIFFHLGHQAKVHILISQEEMTEGVNCISIFVFSCPKGKTIMFQFEIYFDTKKTTTAFW